MSASTITERIDVIESTARVEQLLETTSSADSIVEKVKKSKTFEWFYQRNYDKYFEFVKAKSEKSVLVQCLLCPPRKQLVCTINSAYNLTVHIKSSHHQDVKQFTERTQKRKMMEILPSNDSSESKRRQTTIDKFSEGGSITQARLDRLVFNYIIDKVQPFSIVQSESFKEMVLSDKSKKLNIMSRDKLSLMLIREHNLLSNGQIDCYSKIDFFCLTADLWSSRRRAFLGITIHWICPNSYSRQKNSLACRRVTGVHSSDVLARHIYEIIQFFKIPIRKILKIVTDGCTNFKKAFKEHQVECNEEDDDDDEGEEDLASLLAESNSGEIFLPPQKRCASHSLCLVLTTDVKLKKPKKKKNAAPKRREKELTASEREFNEFRETVLDPVLEKCQKLFNKQSNSPKAADLVHSYLHRYLVTPSPTRWNSMFDSVSLVSELLDEKPKEMESVMTGLGLEKFSSRDREILKEYIEVTRNVADALDVLQGEVYMYQGVFSPTIHKMKQKINDLTDLKFCLPLKERILKSVEKRLYERRLFESDAAAPFVQIVPDAFVIIEDKADF
ncbi:hypothetical protein Bhyg_03335 [Pseudolycoriella hygida]|uniref:Transposase n=1 Tax=Pseudolycoriella hygida TaxID=35572 RepID=A0A9Q0S9A6_9DIPT|nr:hypothetical protein Bhyg_03335 [Pseudolycoriella hygida]